MAETAPGTSSSSLLESLSGEAHLWLADADTEEDPRRRQACIQLLPDSEREASERFRFPADRDRYLLARAMVRMVLSLYAGIDPIEWRFRTNTHGRPEIGGPPDVPPLRFSLSHTRGLVACLIGLELDVGVDAERLDDLREIDRIADYAFHPNEAEDLRARAAPERRQRFYYHWTLKEAYSKAVGMGFSLAFSSFRFAISDRGTIVFDAGTSGNESGHWNFAVMQRTDRHVIATAVRTREGADIPLVIHGIDPPSPLVRPVSIVEVAATPSVQIRHVSALRAPLL